MRAISSIKCFKGVLLLFAISFLSTTLLAQTGPPMQWKKHFGGTVDETPESIVKTNDGGCIVVGSVNSNDFDVVGNHGGGDMWAIRLDSNGKVQWKKCFGSSKGSEVGYSIAPTGDGNFIIGATTTDAGEDVTKHRHNIHYQFTDVWLVKISGSGALLWEKSYGGISSDEVRKIIRTNDGGYLFAGATRSNDDDVSGNHGQMSTSPGTVETSDIWLVKIDSVGGVLWQKCLGGTQGEMANDILETRNNGILLIGNTNSSDGDVNKLQQGADAWVVSMDGLGNIQWNKTFGGTGTEVGYSIIENVTGGYVFTASTESKNGDVTNNNGKADMWLVAIDDTGKILWDRSFGGSENEVPYSLLQTPDSSYLLSGYTASNDKDVSVNKGAVDWWICKVNKNGQKEWDKTFGTNKGDRIYAASVVNDGYLLAGHMGDNSGDLLNIHRGRTDWVVIKLRDTTVTTGINEKISKEPIKVYPSPTSGLVYIDLPQGYEKAEVKVYDMMGKMLQVSATQQGANRTIDLSRFSSGTYTIQVIHDDVQQSYKVIKQQ